MPFIPLFQGDAHQDKDDADSTYILPLNQVAGGWSTYVLDHDCIVMDSTKDSFWHGSLRIPDDYSSSPSLVWWWSHLSTTGNYRWEFEYDVVADGDTALVTTLTSGFAATIAGPTTSADWKESTQSISGTLTAGDMLVWRFGREGTNVADTGTQNILNIPCCGITYTAS